MEIVYYPDMYISSDRLLKQLLLCWGDVKTIMPPSERGYFEAYVAGDIKHEIAPHIERYKQIYDIAGEKVVDALEIGDEERRAASEKMLDVLTSWNADTGFYNSLKINDLSDLIGKTVEWYWFLHEKLEWPLVQLMLQDRLVVDWGGGEIVGFQEVGKSYMSVIASELQRQRRVRLITDDEFYLAAKAPSLQPNANQVETDGGYQLVSLGIPQVFIEDAALDNLSWKEVFKIREDLLPFAEVYYSDIEAYQAEINSLAANNKDDEAFDKFCEFCGRVASSFRPFSKEMGKAVRLLSRDNLTLTTGIVLPTVKLMVDNPAVGKVCDFAAIALTAASIAASDIKNRIGFEYLENLNRSLDIARMKNTLTSLIPKSLR